MRRTKDEVKAELFSRLDEYKIKRAARHRTAVVCTTLAVVAAVTLSGAYMAMAPSKTDHSPREHDNLTGSPNLYAGDFDGALQTTASNKTSPNTDVLLSGLLGGLRGEGEKGEETSGNYGNTMADVRLGLIIESDTSLENNVFCNDVISFLTALEKFEASDEEAAEFDSPITFTVREMDGTEHTLQYENGSVIYLGKLYVAADGGAEIDALLAQYGFEVGN